MIFKKLNNLFSGIIYIISRLSCEYINEQIHTFFNMLAHHFFYMHHITSSIFFVLLSNKKLAGGEQHFMLFADGKYTGDSRISGARGCSPLVGTK